MKYDAHAYMQCNNLLHRIDLTVDSQKIPLTTNQTLIHDLINFLSSFELTDDRAQFKLQVEAFFEAVKSKKIDPDSKIIFIIAKLALQVLKRDLERDLNIK